MPRRLNQLTRRIRPQRRRPLRTDLVFDYAVSCSELPNEWTVPMDRATECARRFIDTGAPDTEEVLFEQD